MNYVLSSCFTCNRITARKFLRVKRLIDLGDKGTKVLVCMSCEKKLQLPKGVENWIAPVGI
jgi:hypothetical protein